MASPITSRPQGLDPTARSQFLAPPLNRTEAGDLSMSATSVALRLYRLADERTAEYDPNRAITKTTRAVPACGERRAYMQAVSSTALHLFSTPLGIFGMASATTLRIIFIFSVIIFSTASAVTGWWGTHIS